ncbi:MAG: FlgD immunoglobulin-like domain containing protein [candidate division WOR-3 bacterium]
MHSYKKPLLLTVVMLSIVWAGPSTKKQVSEPEITLLRPMELELRTPAPVWDTNRVWPGATANLTRKVAIGKYFKGALDDTIRLVTVQSGGTRNLVIATDTMSSSFVKNGFRIETPYAFASGSTPHAVAVGDVDGDEYIDILAAQSATPYRLFWFEWDTGALNWVVRDSLTVNNAINDITFGDGDNNATTRDFYINIAQTSPSAAIMRIFWTGTAWDTLRILLSGGVSSRGVAVGDIRPELAGNEVYAVGSSRIWQVYFNGVSWDTATITSGVSGSYDVVVGDVNPVNSGNELCVVHGSTSYQVSIWNWTGANWSGILWAFTSTWGTSDNTLEIGDVLKENPGNELVLMSGASTTAQPRVFWYAPSGNAWVSTLPKSVGSQSDYGVAIGDINRFRTFNSEFVLSGGGSLVEVEEHDFVDDIGTYWIRMKNPTAIINLPDTITAVIFNAGSNPKSNFNVGYRFKNSPLTGSFIYTGTLNPGAIDSIKFPVTLDFLGMDSLYVFTSLAGDAWILNDTTRLHLEVYDETTKVASTFNNTAFPPANATISPMINTPDTWWRTILSGSYNWARYTSGTNPTCSPYEGYGMAGYPSYNASSGSQARLRTHRFNIGPTPKKVMLRFYMYHDPGYSTNSDSVIIEFSYNDTTYNRVAGFHRYNATAGWYLHDVEIGDFPANKDLYIGFKANSGYGNNMFIDSARVFITTPTAPVVDAGIQNITPFAPPIFVGETLTVQVLVRNYGLQTLTSTPVFYTLGGADTVWENWTGSLEINETALYTFTTNFIPTTAGEETLYAGTKLTGDQNPANDVASLVFLVCPEYHTLPYTKNFDEAWTNSTNPPFCGWTIVDGGTQSPPVIDNNDWHRYVSSSPARTVARVYYSPVEWTDDWLISPRFDCSQLGYYTLSYWHWYDDYTTNSPDSGRVLLSTDGGANWQTVAIYSNADDSGYKSIDVSSLAMGHNNVKIAFHYVAYNEWRWYIDDFLFDFAPDTIPPTITFVQEPQNTYQTGPYIVRARINDITGIGADSLYYIVNDVITAIPHTAISGDTFTFEIPGQTPGTEVEYFVIARDNLANRAYTSTHRFWVLSPLAPTDLVVTGQADSTVRLDWLPPAEEISYYSGVNYYWYGWLAGDAIATQYTPQYYPCKLEAAALLFYQYSDTIEFHIWADDGNGNPGTSLFVDTIIISQLYPNFEVIDLSQANITINSGSFHVGFIWLGDDTPYPMSDNGSNTTRSKYYDGTDWYPAGYDWVMSAYVSYLPGAKRTVGQPKLLASGTKVSLRKLHRKPISDKENFSSNLSAEILGISNFSIERGTTQGGPYTQIGTTTSSFFIDTTVVNENRYYYVVKAIYTQPDTVSYYSNEVNIGVDFAGPLYNNTTFDSMAAGPWVVSTEITDWIGLAYDSLAYRTDGGSFSYITSDSIAGDIYYYTIPDFPAGTLIEFYLFSQDTSWWQNIGRDPASGYYAFTSHTGIADSKTAKPIPRFVFLNQCQPNPFDRTTRINYGIPKQMHVNISIYNAIGQLTKTLIDGELEPGYYSILWDGRDQKGRQLANGIYFVRLSTPDKKFIKKAVLLH